ncbi:hypothetical protein UCDDA912_g05167 [Diaporthe ampelina]|uniref:Uncharacterized protein n=1 Tax=Diaporthe ampelina TaxID=1214573 RepID=A0A0G2HIJ6_9PEZI|nr:hypothetical protein UCDDA912_g05167 [Diaporthe ampelina]
MAAHTCFWLLVSLAATALAQSSIIPSGLSSGFTDSLGLEVSYQGVGSRFDGIPDGSTVSATDASTDPVFALSDQSAINTRIAFLVMMLDTTDPDAPVLHFAQDQFKADGEQTGISSQAQPLVPYARPGSLGDTGQRQYSFLLFQQQAGSTVSGLPQAGETLDVDQFLTANNMRAARAGVGIVVDNGGGAAAPSASASSAAATNTPVATFTSVTPTPPTVTSQASVSVLPTSAAATGQPLPSSTLLTSVATGSPTGAATPSASATSGSSGSSSGEASSGSGAVTAGGSVLEAVSARTLGLVAGLIGGVLLI